MSITRRQFVKSSASVSAIGTLSGFQPLVASTEPASARMVTSRRMAWAAGSRYRPYLSKVVPSSATPTWLQIDLGATYEVEGIRLYPAFTPSDAHAAGYGFPSRFKIEVSREPGFATGTILFDHTSSDCPDPFDTITEIYGPILAGRYVRLTATRLTPAQDGVGYQLAISKIDVTSRGKDIAERCTVSTDAEYGNPTDLTQVTRPRRPMGEGIETNNAHNVTLPDSWHTIPFKNAVPLSGVRLQGTIFRGAMQDNINYLLESSSVDEMLQPFRERAGKPLTSGLRKPLPFWNTSLPGSSAGRFLMGAGNTLRWMEDIDLRRSMNELVDGIEQCRAANGYIMAYPEDLILHSERGGYTRAWVTHGLIEAGYAGNPRAFPLLRGFYDWFNQCSWLPKMMRGGVQGMQGMIASTRVYFTPVGHPKDIQTIQRYYQENYWLDGLARQDVDAVWQYPYDRPHNYLITDFEAYLDMYRATGDQKYLQAILGAWQLYHDNWEHVGGSIAITEFGEFPPNSYRLEAQAPFCETGETCGSVFWIKLNQRLQQLYPGEEKYTNEIEKSIYNVVLANQVGDHGIIYHARLVHMKGDLHVPICTNSCCEGQGTRLIGSLPEYIYSIDPEGLWINLFEPSTIEWTHAGAPLKVALSGNFPYSPEVKLTIASAHPTQAKIRIRVPQWASMAMSFHINQEASVPGSPASFVTLDRVWSQGDTVKFTLPMSLRLTRYSGLDKIEGHQRFALEYGPVLLALSGSDSAALMVPSGNRHEDILKSIHHNSDRPLHFSIDGHADLLYVPYWQVVSEPFTCYPVIDLT